MNMENNIETKAEPTARLRSKFDHNRKFLSKFYKSNGMSVPTRTELVLSIILLFVGLSVLFFYDDLNTMFRFLIVCGIITWLFRITFYFKTKKG